MVRVLRRTAARCSPVAQTYSIGRSFDGKELLVIEFSSRPGQHELSKPPSPLSAPREGGLGARPLPGSVCTCLAWGCLSPGPGPSSKTLVSGGGQGTGRACGALLGVWGCTGTVTGRVAALGAWRAQAQGRGLHKSGRSDVEGQLRLQVHRPLGTWGDASLLCALQHFATCRGTSTPGRWAGAPPRFL